MSALKFPLRSKPAAFSFMGDPRVVNGYAEEIGEEQRSPVAILGIPGQNTFSEPADDPCRGMFFIEDDDKLYSLHLSKLYSLNSTGTATAISGALPGSLPIIAERGTAVTRSATVTISIASPAVISDPLHELEADDQVYFSTDGALPTGLSAGTAYYVLTAGLTTGQYRVSTSVGGSAVNTSGSQSGTQTRTTGFATVQTAIVSDSATFVLERDTLHFLDLEETANSVATLNLRHLYGTDGGRVYYSAVNDARDVSALNYFTAEKMPDGLMRVFVHLGEAMLFGKKTCELWGGTDDTDLPFRPLGGSYVPKGLLSKMAVASFDNGVAFLGHDGVVYRLSGYQAQRISDHGVESAIKSVSDKSTIYAYSHTYNGHEFLVLTCPSWTWALDAATGFWAERKSYLRDDWRAYPYCEAWGRHFVGDKASGEIREIDGAAFDEAGEHLITELTLPDLSSYPNELIIDELHVDTATGVGLNVASTVDGYNPRLMLWGSIDGGETWPLYREESLGRQGQWLPGVVFSDLGASDKRGWRLHLSVSEPCGRGFLIGDVRAEATKR